MYARSHDLYLHCCFDYTCVCTVTKMRALAPGPQRVGAFTYSVDNARVKGKAACGPSLSIVGPCRQRADCRARAASVRRFDRPALDGSALDRSMAGSVGQFEFRLPTLC